MLALNICPIVYINIFLRMSLLLFSISTERHRAEVRRAVNDERLNTIAYQSVHPYVANVCLLFNQGL